MGIFKHKEDNSDLKQKDYSEIKWPEYVINLNEENFENFIKKYPFSLVDFWASYCAPCKKMAPRLRRLSKIYYKKVAFGKIDIQKYKDISKKYNIMGIPYLAVFSKGQKISSFTGVKSVGDIKDEIDKILKEEH